MSMKVLPRFILIKIDKAKQKTLQEKVGNIYISPKYLYMKFNLQYGEVMQIGERAAKVFPDMKVGNTAIFRHTIESDDWRLMHKEFNPKYPGDYSMRDEYRIVDTSSINGREILGYINSYGTWIANDLYIYVNADVKPVETQYFTSLLLSTDGAWKDDQAIMAKIEEMKLDQQNIKDSIVNIRDPYKLEDTYKYIGRIAQDMERLTKLIHAKKVCKGTVEIVGSQTSRELGIKPGSTIFIDDYALMYSLNIMDKKYMLIENEYVFGVLN